MTMFGRQNRSLNEYDMSNLKWYQKTSGIVLMIVLFFPIGLFLMWRHSSWSMLTKGVITGVFAVALIYNPNRDARADEIHIETTDQLVEESESNIDNDSEDISVQTRQESKQARQDPNATTEKEREQQKCVDDADALYGELQEMHEELQSFRKTEDFNLYGFGRGGKFYPWLEKVGKMKDDPRNKCCLMYKNCVAGELEMLGLEYVTSDGVDTEYSIATSKLFGGSPPKSKNTESTSSSASNSNSSNWYEGGTLHQATVARWKASNEQNKLATCGDFMATYDKSVSSMAVLKMRAEELKTCIDVATSGSDETNNVDVTTVAALCIQEMGY